MTPFKFHRTQVAKSRMTTAQIVKAFEVEKDVATRSGVRCKGLLLDKFGFERGPEARHQSIVVQAPLADLRLGDLQVSLVVVAGMLAAAVSMVQQPRRRLARDQRCVFGHRQLVLTLRRADTPTPFAADLPGASPASGHSASPALAVQHGCGDCRSAGGSLHAHTESACSTVRPPAGVGWVGVSARRNTRSPKPPALDRAGSLHTFSAPFL